MAGDFSAIAGNKRLAPHTTGEIHHLRESDKNPNAKAPERKVVPAVMNVSGKHTNASDFFQPLLPCTREENLRLPLR